MLCHDFEDRLTDYLDGALDVEAHQKFSEHAMRCPVCHDLLAEVKNTLVACSASEAPPASAALEARILLKTVPEAALTCAEFEDYLTDYLDGFLMAPIYHRWERHAALCENCSELPGDVVRSIGACYTYKQDELTVPAGLEARILQSTIGNVVPGEVRAPFMSRLVEWLRGTLDPIVSPQLATVATMLLVAVFVLTNTVSTDGSVRGIYMASVQLAQRTADKTSKSVDDLIRDDSKLEKPAATNKNQSEPNSSRTAPPATGESKPDPAKEQQR